MKARMMSNKREIYLRMKETPANESVCKAFNSATKALARLIQLTSTGSGLPVC